MRLHCNTCKRRMTACRLTDRARTLVFVCFNTLCGNTDVLLPQSLIETSAGSGRDCRNDA